MAVINHFAYLNHDYIWSRDDVTFHSDGSHTINFGTLERIKRAIIHCLAQFEAINYFFELLEYPHSQDNALKNQLAEEQIKALHKHSFNIDWFKELNDTSFDNANKNHLGFAYLDTLEEGAQLDENLFRYLTAEWAQNDTKNLLLFTYLDTLEKGTQLDENLLQYLTAEWAQNDTKNLLLFTYLDTLKKGTQLDENLLQYLTAEWTQNDTKDLLLFTYLDTLEKGTQLDENLLQYLTAEWAQNDTKNLLLFTYLDTLKKGTQLDENLLQYLTAEWAQNDTKNLLLFTYLDTLKKGTQLDENLLQYLTAEWAQNDTKNLLIEKYLAECDGNTSNVLLLNLLKCYATDWVRKDIKQQICEYLNRWIIEPTKGLLNFTEKYGDHDLAAGSVSSNPMGCISQTFINNLFDEYRQMKQDKVESKNLYSLLSFIKFIIKDLSIVSNGYCNQVELRRIEKKYLDFILYELIQDYADNIEPINRKEILVFTIEKTKRMLDNTITQCTDLHKNSPISNFKKSPKKYIDESTILYKILTKPLLY